MDFASTSPEPGVVHLRTGALPVRADGSFGFISAVITKPANKYHNRTIHYTVEFENDEIRVVRIKYGAKRSQ